MELEDPATGKVYNRRIKPGPDIVAYKGDRANPTEIAIVEVKSSPKTDTKLSLHSSLLKSSMAEGYYQPFWQWVEKRAGQRYLNKMLNAKDPDVKQAGRLLREVVNQQRSYTAVVVGYGVAGTRLGDIDAVVGQMNYTDPRTGYKGVSGTQVYTVNVE